MGKKKVAVIGGGPGGYVAAIRAAQLGGEVTLIEKNKLGGTCLNVGCIPTKALLHASEFLSCAREAADYGIQLDVKSVNWSAVQKKKASVVAKLVGGVTGLMKANKIRVINGTASFAGPKKLNIEQQGKVSEEAFDSIIIAAGSVPAVPPIPGLKDNPRCIDSTGALSLENIPKKMTVIGGGVIGVELASVYHTFGTEIQIVEALPAILPNMDGELAQMLRKRMEKQGIKIMTDSRVVSIEEKGPMVIVEVEKDGKKQKIETEIVLVAVGRRASTESLNLDKAGIRSEKGKILTDDHLMTNVPDVYAIGDCLGKVMLAHTASAQGEIAAENIMGHEAVYDERTCPSCIYTELEFAGVGLTEEQAKAAKIDYQAGRFPMMANGKSLIMNGGEGMIKVLLGKEYKEILGVHILAPRATDMIGECALAIGMEATAEDVEAVIHAHPTVSEALREAVMAADKHAIHIFEK